MGLVKFYLLLRTRYVANSTKCNCILPYAYGTRTLFRKGTCGHTLWKSHQKPLYSLDLRRRITSSL